METPKYLVRLDDASEYMSIKKWDAFFSLFDEYGIKPIVAVIPHVEDKKLITDHPIIENFWELVSVWQTKGYVIALHGFNHVYTTKKSGIIKKNERSEFAGVSYKKQERKIEEGLKIFREHGINTKMFVAPAHSFDANTIKALINKSDIRIISDGYTQQPFFYKGMHWIPQQLSKPAEKSNGVWTICYHPETADQCQIDELRAFIEKNNASFVSPDDIQLTSIFTDEDKSIFREQQELFMRKHRLIRLKRYKKMIKNYLYQLKRTPARIWKWFIYTASPILPDKFYMKQVYKIRMGKELNLKNPVTFNEKLSWLKLYYHRPDYTMMADKILAKEWVASIIGEEYIIPTLGVWNNPDEIDFGELPARFVLKCNHNSGLGMYICKNKNEMDIEKVKSELRKGLKQNYYRLKREWQYKDINRRILAEKYMEDKYGELRDYKFFCFNGTVKAMFVASDRSKGEEETCFDFFDDNYNHLPFTQGHPNAKVEPAKPECFEEMKVLAAKLSKGIPQVRIDFYEVDSHIYFGEMTFCHWSGNKPFVPEEWDYRFGEWIKLPDSIK